MYKFKRSLIALIGLVSLVAIATVTTPHLSYGSGGPTAAAPSSQPQNVNVVNTPTVSAQQSGIWNVGINGTPVVKIDNSDPLVVRDVDCPVQRIEVATGVLIEDGETIGLRTITSVPVGKTLVVEYISIDGRLTNQRLVSTKIQWFQFGDFGPSTFLTLTDQGKDILGQEVFTGSQSVRLYFSEGTDVTITAERNATLGQTTVIVSLSGYLVNN